MSAIAGLVFFNGDHVAPGTVEKMTSAMAARGPDGKDHWHAAGVGLGHCMLRTTPEALHESQPLANEDASAVLVLAGRVDNREELRRDLLLRGAVLRDATDAELVLRAWEQWGKQSPERIIGDFVYFVWDATRRELFGARDVAGIRHFHYASGDGWFAFASEPGALLATQLLRPVFNTESLLDYVGCEYDRIDDSGTLYKNIFKLPLGHAMTVSAGGLRTWPYWYPENLSMLEFSSPRDYTEAFGEQLRIAVKSRLRAIGPVAACLSGGLDSSSIVALISKEFRGELAEPLRTFSQVRAAREQCDDWPHIQTMLADKWLVPTILPSDLSEDQCRQFIAAIPSLTSPYELSEGLSDQVIADAASAQGCRVLLDGVAGDLMFLSAESSLEYIFRYRMFKFLPQVLAAFRRHGIGGAYGAMFRKCVRGLLPGQLQALYRKHRDANILEAVLAGEGALQYLPAAILAAYVNNRRALKESKGARSQSSRQQAGEALVLLSPLLACVYEQGEPLFGARGIERRCPWSDRRLMEFVIRMPLPAKMTLGWYKSLLRDSMAGILPESVRWRRKILGHPGGKFYERLIACSASQDRDFWLQPVQDDFLATIAKKSAILGALDSVANPGSQAAYDGLRIAILYRWLRSHGTFQTV